MFVLGRGGQVSCSARHRPSCPALGVVPALYLTLWYPQRPGVAGFVGERQPVVVLNRERGDSDQLLHPLSPIQIL